MTSEQQAALRGAMALGYPAFPCGENKIPACPHGFKDATSTTSLATLWARYPGKLIGVPSGAASGVSVLDIDKRGGGLEWWKNNNNRLPPTRLHRTRSGGVHALFKHREGLKCSTSRIAPGVDVRADGGYFIWWPARGLTVLDAPIADWPEWLTPPEPPKPTSTPYVKAWPRPAGAPYSIGVENKLRGLARYVAGSPSGQRNATVYWAACRVGELMNVGAVEHAFARDVLIEAATMSGLSEFEAQRTVVSALRRVAA
jgi:hypothetical protein